MKVSLNSRMYKYKDSFLFQFLHQEWPKMQTGKDLPKAICHPFACFKLNLIFAVPKWNARVAKLVDALCSGRSVRKDVLVRIRSRAPQK